MPLILSPFQQFIVALLVFAFALVAYAVGLAEGRERFRRQLIDHAREDGIKALRFLRGHL